MKLREYQERIVSKAVAAFKDGHRHVLLESPTGSGKTIVALALSERLYDTYGFRTGWCTLRRHLLIQAAEENRVTFGLKHIEFFSVFSKELPQVELLILDECQHQACDTAAAVINRINPRLEIGLTATPFRVDGAKLAYSRTIRDAGIRALIDQGYLAPFHQYTFAKPWTPENVAEIYLKDRQRWGRTVGYFMTKKECDACAATIRSEVPCEVVWAGSEQEKQIEAFGRGDVPILLNMFILTEGFNDASLKTVLVRPASRGPTIQMTGRALRPKPFAQIVQNEDAPWPFTETASCERRFALGSRGWEERGVASHLVESVSNRVIASRIASHRRPHEFA